MKNTKAQGIGINTIVMMVIAVLVMVSLALFFTGAFTAQGSELTGSAISGTAATDVEAAVICNQYCTAMASGSSGGLTSPSGCTC